MDDDRNVGMCLVLFYFSNFVQAGLMLISVFFQPFVEKLFVLLIVCCSDRRFRTLVFKSLSSHRSRNRKTAIMFTSTLAFIIFSGSEFALQSKEITDSLRISAGSDMVFRAPRFAFVV
jgi:hypothetical protein